MFIQHPFNRNLRICCALLLCMLLPIRPAMAEDSIRVAALCYHDIYTEADVAAGKDTAYAVLDTEFASHLQYLADQGIRAVTIEDLCRYTRGEIDLPEKCVLLTADDGLRSFYLNGFPLLVRQGMPVSMAIIGEKAHAASDEKSASRKTFCTWDEIADMASSGLVEMGAHTFGYHSRNDQRKGILFYNAPDTSTYAKFLQEDLAPLNQTLEQVCGYKPRFFTYPYYAVSVASVSILTQNLGYTFLLAGDTKSMHRYLGGDAAAENYNRFTKGQAPQSPLIKRYTPDMGDDFPALIETIFGETLR